jgi:hypothetical protein
MSNSTTDEAAKVQTSHKKAVCHDCDREWTGAGTKEIAEKHSARYDHNTVYRHTIDFDGPKDGESDA